MKEQAIAIAASATSPAEKLNVLREYLQAFALRSLHESEAFLSLSFVGGTALRFAFNLPRFSEDLDFSLENPEAYLPLKWMKKLKNDMMLAGFDVSINWNDRKTVHAAWIKVGGILKETGLVAMADQKLSIKLKIDTRPPAGAECTKTIINRHLVFALQYHSLPSLMAGKTHALLTRKYQKGRDWYDLLWYLGKRPPLEPNMVLLQNALDQTQGAGTFNALDWRSLLEAKVRELDYLKISADVHPFLERPKEAELMTAEHYLSLLSRP
ncbi:hypothetical protein PDESU_03818 [Pontiella desulfatans]|uniref:Nucleotidyl transferase AbiEii/AbiGii toxin family protein n=1 Tax=Pontiella desulfatans TaxID=2750659 RepID=A0A6C2U759_PONDE|nr:nucleotidyl transferase AbiEii/AbiGii toxin family protein [Pontiella desulfatans]VGO15236.1 hypothetical protein PDESU_03818 [Pontiella desulfatans]